MVAPFVADVANIALDSFTTFAANVAFASNAANDAKYANMATKIFSVAAMKGGCGKSTVSILLASALAKEKGKRVLIIDTDSQRSVSQWFEIERQSETAKQLVQVEEMAARQVQPFLKRSAKDFDFIFLDIPRVTDRNADSPAVMLLYFCDAILIPVIGAQIDVISTLDFLSIVADVSASQKKNGFSFSAFGFINRHNRRKDNEQAAGLLSAQGLQMFANNLPDLKIFTSPTLYGSILDSNEGRQRFGAFFAEFCNKFKIK